MVDLNLGSSRYMNTASITLNRGVNVDIVTGYFSGRSGDCAFDKLVVPQGVSMFFSPNATQCMLAFVEYKILRCNFSLDVALDKALVHPIIYKALGALPTSSGHGLVRIFSLMHWITGEFFQDVLGLEQQLHHRESLVVVDAVQAIGAISVDEIQAIFKLVLNGTIVVGCLQKWLGCPVPLGFALVPTLLLEEDIVLQKYLAIRDYLGPSIGDRLGYETFPDTYSASLAPLFMQPLRRALGNDPEASERHRELIEANRQLICESVNESSILDSIVTKNDCRGMVAASAKTEEAVRISETLLKNGFVHSIFHDFPCAGTSTLRLSAPLVEMDAESLNLFQASLLE